MLRDWAIAVMLLGVGLYCVWLFNKLLVPAAFAERDFDNELIALFPIAVTDSLLLFTESPIVAVLLL